MNRASGQERRALGEIRDALTSSLHLGEVMRCAYPLLLELVSADHGALGITAPGRPAEFEWIVANLVPEFFSEYPQMATDDFVLRSVKKAPNVVLRDSEMIPRRELESNTLHRRARELGMPLEQVMGVMLHADSTWSSGIALYRSSRHPFSVRDRSRLQEVTPAFVHAVRNCRAFQDVERRGSVLEALMGEQRAVVVLVPPAVEVTRSRAAAALLGKWFSSVERDSGKLPEPLLERAREWSFGVPSEPTPFRRVGTDTELEVKPYWVHEVGITYLVLELAELRRTAAIPGRWRARLTQRECDVVNKVLEGWDNLLIGQELGCATATVKQHLNHVFDKLGVCSRAQLIALAHRESTGGRAPLD